jgi:hypothetical protein
MVPLSKTVKTVMKSLEDTFDTERPDASKEMHPAYTMVMSRLVRIGRD